MRLWRADTTVEGQLVDLDTARLIVAASDGSRIEVNRAGLAGAEVRRASGRRHGAGAGRGALIGAGAALAYLGSFVLTGNVSTGDDGAGLAWVVGSALTVASTGVGAILGGIVGLSPVQEWHAFDPLTMRAEVPGA